MILGAWDAEGRRYGVREARLSSDKIASISAPSVENVDDELYDAVIAFTRSPSYGMSDVGTSMFPILKPLVEEISAIDTRNSYMSAYHGMPLFAYFTNNLTPDTRKIANKGDMIAGQLNREIGLKFKERVGGGKELALDGERYKDAKYITWDAEYISKNLSAQERLEHQLAAMVGIPAALINAQGRIQSGSALKRLYMTTYATTRRIQVALLPRVQELIMLVNSVSGESYTIPKEWPNIFDHIDSTSEVNTSISVQDGDGDGESEEVTTEDRPGPEGNNAGIIQQTRPG